MTSNVNFLFTFIYKLFNLNLQNILKSEKTSFNIFIFFILCYVFLYEKRNNPTLV